MAKQIKQLKGKDAQKFPANKPGLSGGTPKERKALLPSKKRK